MSTEPESLDAEAGEALGGFLSHFEDPVCDECDSGVSESDLMYRLKEALDQRDALEHKLKVLEIVGLGRNAVIATLENKLAESRVALGKYGKHLDGCTYGIPQPRFCENPCTCGLRDALNP